MAQPKFEDLVKALQGVDSVFSLSGDLPLLAAGLLDLQNRLHAIEAYLHPSAHPASPHPAPKPARKA